MTTKTEVNNPMEVAQKSWANRTFTQILAAMVILVVGFMGGIFANTQVSLTRQPVSGSEANSQEAVEGARYTGLASFYEAREANDQAIKTESARYSGLATYYGAENQRAIEAEADRYNGLATYYGAVNQRAIEAEAARYSGLAAIYASENTTALLAANPELMKVQSFNSEIISGPSLLDADPAWLLRHRSAEVRAIAKTRLMAANPELMVAQHHAAVPTKDEIDPNSDLGLLEFSPLPAETGGQRIIKSDVNGDVGLLEFFTPQTNRGVSEINPLPIRQPDAIITRQKIEATLLGENPELIKVRHLTAAQVEWNRLHPGR